MSVATFGGTDSGGTGFCLTPPTTLGPVAPGRNVYVNNQLVMANGDILSSVNGTTPKGDPCVSSRTVTSVRSVYVNGQPVAKVGDVLNSSSNITIATGSPNVFVV